MDQNLNSDILDKITKVCICKGISKATIKKAIENGAKSVLEVQKVTGAGSGSCHGRRCTEKIQSLLSIEIKIFPFWFYEIKVFPLWEKDTPRYSLGFFCYESSIKIGFQN